MLDRQGLRALGQQPLPPAQRAIMNVYAQFCGPDGNGAYPAVATLAARTGYSERHVRRVVRALVAAGLLRPTGRGPKGTRQYQVGGHIVRPAGDRGDTMSAESSSSSKEIESLLSNYNSWRTRVRPGAQKADTARGTTVISQGLYETPTARALMAAGLAAAEALRYGWMTEAQVGELISLAERKAARGELRGSKAAYIAGGLRKIEAGERVLYEMDRQRGLFVGTWTAYCEMLAAVQMVPASPVVREAVLVTDDRTEVDDWAEEWAEIDDIYGVSLVSDNEPSGG
ncbi:MAG: hypothetical protein BroJett033_8090 [Chloroflexota bacterium]|nr:MAG: hypothetical protein BroJett033_8090 [Chloroflexota bacterium]